MFTKSSLKQLNWRKVMRIQGVATQPLPVLWGTTTGLLLTIVMGAIAIFQPRSSPIPDSLVTPVSQLRSEGNPLGAFPAWNIATDTLPGAISLPSEPAKRHPKAPSLYDEAMAIGYRAYREQDYQTALINFKRALDYKEGDRHATQAVNNVEAIIQHHRQLEAERHQSQPQSP